MRAAAGLQPAQPPVRSRAVASLAAALVLLVAVAAFLQTPREQEASPVGVHAPVPATAEPRPWFDDEGPNEGPTPSTALQTASAAPRPSLAEWVRQAAEGHDLPARAQAYRLLRHCAFVLAPGRARPLVSPPAWMAWDTVRLADRAWQSMADRCDPLRALPDRETLERRLDPVPAPDADGPAAVPAQHEWLADTFRRHGGAALGWAGEALAAYVERRIGDSDGDAVDPLDPEAIQIARCRLGEDCDPGSDAASAACVTLGACEGDVPQRLLSSLGSRAARERVLRQADRLVEALRSGDLGRYALR